MDFYLFFLLLFYTPFIKNKCSPYSSFFNTYFPDSAFLVARFDGQADIQAETILSREKTTKEDFLELKKRNEAGYGVYFTPNAVKEKRAGGKTHMLDNFWYVNACYIDIDIEETKLAYFPEEFDLRKKKKEAIAGELFFAPLQPSLVIETRNGFQAYWFTNTDLTRFKLIQRGIYEHFEKIGADQSTLKEVQLMRVPGFLHNKEKIKCSIRQELSRTYEDGSYWFYQPGELQAAFPAKIKPKLIAQNYFKTQVYEQSSLFKNTQDIFQKVLKMPILSVIQKINGSRLTGGETLDFGQERNGKMNIIIKGKVTPNWVDLNHNMIFSNTENGFCNIVHFAKWYGLEKYEIAQELKKIFA